MKIGNSFSEVYENRLVERLNSGDPGAVEEFYNAYRDRVYISVLKKVGGDETVAEDIVQETFLAALNSLDRFRGDSRLYTWLRGIENHKVSDFYRHRAQEARSGELFLNTDFITIEQFGDIELLTPSIMETEEARHAIQQALVTLPADYRQVLVLKYIEELPVLQISRVMGKSVKSVEGLLSRARKTLRTSLLGASVSN